MSPPQSTATHGDLRGRATQSANRPLPMPPESSVIPTGRRTVAVVDPRCAARRHRTAASGRPRRGTRGVDEATGQLGGPARRRRANARSSGTGGDDLARIGVEARQLAVGLEAGEARVQLEQAGALAVDGGTLRAVVENGDRGLAPKQAKRVDVSIMRSPRRGSAPRAARRWAGRPPRPRPGTRGAWRRSRSGARGGRRPTQATTIRRCAVRQRAGPIRPRT